MPTDMNAILDNLYLGSIEAALHTDTLKESGITHILTIDDRPLAQETTCQFNSKYIHGLDLQDTDLLTYFDECVDFINEGRNKGGVLIHCFAGMSRSATMVIAYMMSKCNLDLKDAHAYVKKMRTLIRPNLGFMEQLQLYEDMGAKIDKKHNGYRMYKLNQLALRVQAEENVYKSPKEDVYSIDLKPLQVCMPTIFHQTCSPLTMMSTVQMTLSTSVRNAALLSHTVGEGESAFDWRGKQPTNQRGDRRASSSEETCEKSLFIEPVKWMSGMLGNMEGKLSCPKCSSKIGSFIWYGERCPCGAWVAPAFHIQTSKVDEVKPRAPVQIVHPRLVVTQQLPVMQAAGPLDKLESINEAPT